MHFSREAGKALLRHHLSRTQGNECRGAGAPPRLGFGCKCSLAVAGVTTGWAVATADRGGMCQASTPPGHREVSLSVRDSETPRDKRP